MFNNQKFLARVIESEISSWLTNLMWHMVLTIEVEKKDYLQVFKLTKTPTVSTSSTSRSRRRTAMKQELHLPFPRMSIHCHHCHYY